jgi:Ser/Thr protein kinase RdoA (MazF antagonist)
MMPSHQLLSGVLKQYGLAADQFSISPIGSGYIHLTFLMTGEKKYVLQRVNKNVFTNPGLIASNLKIAASHLALHFPDYLFLAVLPTVSGEQMAYDSEGFPWRIFPYFENTYTIDRVETEQQAFSAAAEFGRLSFYLKDAPVAMFRETIERFHDLGWRYEQFEDSLKNGLPSRMDEASEVIDAALEFRFLVDKYKELVERRILKLRITHNDTKINNILFDARTNKAVAAIDLDTLMPGYFIYDIGDMIRTFVSPVDEEEADLDKIIVRPGIYRAIVDGYLSQMNGELTQEEKNEIAFAGMMMTYIMALRMLTDFLNGDVYYQIRYPGQNLRRAKNQFRLLGRLKDFTAGN